MGLFESSVWWWGLTVTIYCVCFLILLSVIIFEFSTVGKNKSTLPNDRLWILTILCAVFYWFSLLSGFGEFIGFIAEHNSEKWCIISWYITPVTSLIAKGFMYNVFLNRIYLAYKNSMFEYNEKYLKYFGIFEVIILLILAVLISLTFSHSYKKINENNNYKQCNGNISIYISLCITLNDIITQSILLYLFIKPLIEIFKLNDNKELNLITLAIKSTILTFISSVTTTLFVLLIPIISPSIYTINVVINVLCLVFFFEKYDRLFEILCCIWTNFIQDPLVKKFEKRTAREHLGSVSLGTGTTTQSSTN